MMTTGYLESKPRPGAMAAVIAIHAAVIAALMMIAPTVADHFEKPLIGKMIDAPVIPPEVIKENKPIIKAQTQRPIAAVRQIVESEAKGADMSLSRDSGSLMASGIGGDLGGSIDLIRIDPPNEAVIIAPRFVGGNAQPPYPPALQRLGIEGTVTVRVLVGVDGRALRIEAVNVDQDAFFSATRDWGLKRWRFAPATRDGEPFQEWRTMTVRFEMN